MPMNLLQQATRYLFFTGKGSVPALTRLLSR